MNLVLPQFRKKRGELVLVLHIDENSISFALFEIQTVNTRILAYGMNDRKSFTLEQNLQEILRQINLRGQISKVVVSFSSHDFRAHVVRGGTKRDNGDFVINERENRSLENEILQRAERDMRKRIIEDSGILPSDFRMNKIEILERKIDGYKVPQFIGVRGKQVECVVLGTFLLLEPFHIIERFVQKNGFKQLEILHIAQAIVYHASKQKKDGIYLYIGNTKTQIGVWRDGKFNFSEGVPVGGDQFIEVFGEVLGMRENIAAEFQERYFTGEVSEEVREKIKSLLLPEIKKFGTLVSKRLYGMKTVLPENIWVFGAGSKIRDIFGMFEEIDETDSAFLQTPTFAFLSPKDILNIENFPHADDPRYTPLFLLVFANNDFAQMKS